MRKNLTLTLILMVALAFLAIGCSSSNSGSASVSASKADLSASKSDSGVLLSMNDQSPGEVIKAAFTKGNEGKYDEAKKYFSSGTIDFMENGMGAAFGGWHKFWSRVTRSGTIKKIEIIGEMVTDNKASVTLKVHYKDGSRKVGTKNLINQGGDWKIMKG